MNLDLDQILREILINVHMIIMEILLEIYQQQVVLIMPTQNGEIK